MAAASDAALTGKDEEAFVLPRARLPEIIVSNVPGSWAYDTMVIKQACHTCLYFFFARAIAFLEARAHRVFRTWEYVAWGERLRSHQPSTECYTCA